jgi:poly(3-hydroxybutyrate) depolymerase
MTFQLLLAARDPRALRRAACALLAAALPALGAATEPPPLPGYNVDPGRITVSGISSGAFMAVQIAVAHSATVEGVGAVAGGPYACANGSAVTAVGTCMAGTPGAPDGRALAQAARQAAAAGRIDPVENLARQKVWLLNGYNDGVVRRPVSDALYEFYKDFADEAQLFYKNNLGAAHSQVTLSYGQACNVNGGNFMNDCDYDAAGMILQHLYGRLAPRTTGPLGGALLRFSQAEFLRTEPWLAGMSGEGFVFVPARCAQGRPCRLHVALHGCKQYAGLIGDDYYAHAGYNEWADTNDLVVLYPQTVATSLVPMNPNGCWDWWGYVDSDYAVKASAQIRAIRAMVERIGSRRTAGPALAPPAAATAAPNAASGAASGAAQDPAPGLWALDATADSVALAWQAMPGAAGANVYRAECTGCPLKRVNRAPVAGLSFSDHGLRPKTGYVYRIRMLSAAGAEGPESNPASASTTEDPPACEPYQRDNMSHWLEGRADLLFGLLYAKGSRDPMGLLSPLTETTLRRTGDSRFAIGPCPLPEAPAPR